MDLVIYESGAIYDGDDLVVVEPFPTPTIVSGHISRGMWLKDPSTGPMVVDKVDSLRFFMGYEGTLVRVWLHPKTQQIMLSSRRNIDISNSSYNGSITFGEMAKKVLPERSVLFKNPRVVHCIVFVDPRLYQATKFGKKCDTYGVYLYSRTKKDDGWKTLPVGDAPPQSKSLFPKKTDFVEKFGRILSRRELTLEEANHVLTKASGDHRYFEIGEFIFCQTPCGRHIRVNSPSYQWRRDVVGNTPSFNKRFEEIYKEVREVNWEYLLPATINNFGTPVKLVDGKVHLETKQWQEMTPAEVRLTLKFIYANCLPNEGYSCMMNQIYRELESKKTTVTPVEPALEPAGEPAEETMATRLLKKLNERSKSLGALADAPVNAPVDAPVEKTRSNSLPGSP